MERFWSNVNKTKTCWLWARSKKSRYGSIRINGKQTLTHRLSWEFHYGKIPKDLFVCHRCDVMKCVRPDHLFLGTPRDNSIDRDTKGRGKVPNPSHPGEINPRAILTWEIVNTLRREYIPGYGGITRLARKYRLTESLVGEVIRRRCWK